MIGELLEKIKKSVIFQDVVVAERQWLIRKSPLN